jgi:16S rRNA (adenine1518-N6/adenine1519-N6)-dimethyltransferase
VKAGFNQRRKMLRSALNQVLKKDYLHGEYFNKRAEQLSLADFIQLTQDAAAHVQ